MIQLKYKNYITLKYKVNVDHLVISPITKAVKVQLLFNVTANIKCQKHGYWFWHWLLH